MNVLPFLWLNVIVDISASLSLLYCFVLGLMYVAFLYICADNRLGRNHPQTVKNRFYRVSICSLVSIILFSFCCSETEKGKPMFVLLGLTCKNCWSSIIAPLILTMILFSGPLLQSYYAGLLPIYADFSFWKSNFRNLTWIRDHIMGPVTEEIVYRACMVPVLLPHYGEFHSAIICPLFFGLAHFHHMYEMIKEDVPVSKAVLKSSFQFSYTTLFGIYSAFLFMKTGSLWSCIITHMFCNHMGFPDLKDAFTRPDGKRAKVITVYVAGLLLWSILLYTISVYDILM